MCIRYTVSLFQSERGAVFGRNARLALGCESCEIRTNWLVERVDVWMNYLSNYQCNPCNACMHMLADSDDLRKPVYVCAPNSSRFERHDDPSDCQNKTSQV